MLQLLELINSILSESLTFHFHQEREIKKSLLRYTHKFTSESKRQRSAIKVLPQTDATNEPIILSIQVDTHISKFYAFDKRQRIYHFCLQHSFTLQKLCFHFLVARKRGNNINKHFLSTCKVFYLRLKTLLVFYSSQLLGQHLQQILQLGLLAQLIRKYGPGELELDLGQACSMVPVNCNYRLITDI